MPGPVGNQVPGRRRGRPAQFGLQVESQPGGQVELDAAGGHQGEGGRDKTGMRGQENGKPNHKQRMQQRRAMLIALCQPLEQAVQR